MLLNWDAAPGVVRKYIIIYKPEDGESKEVSLSPITQTLIYDRHTETLFKTIVSGIIDAQ